jgi:DNA-3-methyladenine glycosylase I
MTTLVRCNWVNNNPKMIEYHDAEWGVPVFNDQKLFEFLMLESAQAGLSWETVLNKREGYREAFANFDPEKVSKLDDKKIIELLQNPAIIRNRLKVNATVNNAKRFLEVQKEFGSFSKYIWSFVNNSPIQNEIKKSSEIPATTEISDKLSKDLIKRGFKFVGSTIVYAHMQATGMVNDHLTSCFRYTEVKE